MNSLFDANFTDILMTHTSHTTDVATEDLESFIMANLTNDALEEVFDFNKLNEFSSDNSSTDDTIMSLTPVSSESSISNDSQPSHESPSVELNMESASGSLLNPISFILPELETDDGTKIKNEIILNFEATGALESTVEGLMCGNTIQNNSTAIEFKIEELELINELISAKSQSNLPVKETRIDINDDSTRTDDEDDDDDDDNEEPEVHTKEYAKTKSSKTGKVVLTAEEVSVYSKEGFKVPNQWPLTKSEEKILKLVRRKIRNKKSAHVSRERKKLYVDGLEKRVDMCTKENENLLSQVKLLKNQNSDLMKKLNGMQSILSRLLNQNKKASTAVLFISCFITFCAYPYIDLNESDPETLYTLRNGFSRTLLSMPDEPINPSISFGEFLANNASTGFNYFYNLVFS